jgi:hypothetical protein
MTDELKPICAQRTPQTPEEAELDYVPNPRPDTLYLARFAVPGSLFMPGHSIPGFCIWSSIMRRTKALLNQSR